MTGFPHIGHTEISPEETGISRKGFSDVRTEFDRAIKLISSRHTAISHCWRKNISNIETEELSYCLRAIRKVLGHIGTNTGSVEWSGMSKKIAPSVTVLNYELVLDEYPIPHQKFDYLAGTSIYEASLRTQWTDRVFQNMERETIVSFENKPLFHRFIKTAEDIYLYHSYDGTIFQKYLDAKYRVEDELTGTENNASNGYIADVLFHLWFRLSCNMNTACYHSSYDSPIRILGGVARDLKKIGRLEKGILKKSQLRTRLYVDSFSNLIGHIETWQMKKKQLLWFTGKPFEHCDQKNSQTDKNNRSLPSSVLNNIYERLSVFSSDLTPVIRSAVSCDNENIVPTSRWDFDIPAHPVIDLDSVKRLKASLFHYADRKTVFNRGLTEGKIDRRKLYRANVTGRVFYDIQKIPVMDWNICILIDATGSMAGQKWQLVINTLGTFHKSFRGYQNRLSAFAYFETEGILMISSLIKNDTLLTIPPSGKTASGQAIIAAAHSMPKGRYSNFLVHITDGESNIGCHVKYGIDYCRKKNIYLVTLGIGYKNRGAMEDQYGKGIQFIDHFSQLPAAMETLFKWVLLYRKRKKLNLNLEELHEK